MVIKTTMTIVMMRIIVINCLWAIWNVDNDEKWWDDELQYAYQYYAEGQEDIGFKSDKTTIMMNIHAFNNTNLM